MVLLFILMELILPMKPIIRLLILLILITLNIIERESRLKSGLSKLRVRILLQ
jgi:hypothetical protein